MALSRSRFPSKREYKRVKKWASASFCCFAIILTYTVFSGKEKYAKNYIYSLTAAPTSVPTSDRGDDDDMAESSSTWKYESPLEAYENMEHSTLTRDYGEYLASSDGMLEDNCMNALYDCRDSLVMNTSVGAKKERSYILQMEAYMRTCFERRPIGAHSFFFAMELGTCVFELGLRAEEEIAESVIHYGKAAWDDAGCARVFGEAEADGEVGKGVQKSSETLKKIVERKEITSKSKVKGVQEVKQYFASNDLSTYTRDKCCRQLDKCRTMTNSVEFSATKPELERDPLIASGRSRGSLTLHAQKVDVNALLKRVRHVDTIFEQRIAHMNIYDNFHLPDWISQGIKRKAYNEYFNWKKDYLKDKSHVRYTPGTHDIDPEDINDKFFEYQGNQMAEVVFREDGTPEDSIAIQGARQNIGYHSRSFEETYRRYNREDQIYRDTLVWEPFRKLYTFMSSGIKSYLQLYGNPKLDPMATNYTINNLEAMTPWIAYYEHSTSHMIHNHGSTSVSGVFYVQTPAENPSPIVFYDARGCRDFDDSYQHFPPFNAGKVVVPREVDIVLFPPWLSHEIPGELEDAKESPTKRIAIAFNYGDTWESTMKRPEILRSEWADAGLKSQVSGAGCFRYERMATLSMIKIPFAVLIAVAELAAILYASKA